MDLSWSDVGLGAGRRPVRDLWARQALGSMDRLLLDLAPHASALLRAGPAAPSAANAAARDSAAPLAVVTVQPESLGTTIPRGFVGFSLEVSTAGQGIAAFQGGATPAAAEQAVYALGRPGAPNTAYFHFMRNLGPGTLRLGGNSQDNVCWDRAAAPHPEACAGELTAGDLRLFAAAARGSGWKLIVGLNLKQNDPAWAVREVTEGIAREIPASSVFALEPGNEPTQFAGTPARPGTYTAADNLREFLAYLEALRSSPVARRYAVVGPAEIRSPRNLAVFLDGAGRYLEWVTIHDYRETTCGGGTVSAARLLSPELMDGFDAEARPLVALARAHNLPIAMAETNSVSCGGMPGVSNAFASALWGLDYAFSLARDGFVQVDFHTSYRPGGGSSYNPIDTYAQRDAAGHWTYRNVAEALYYALYLFSRHAAGGHLLPTAVASAANVRAYAVRRCVGCAVSVFVLNKDTSAAGPVRLRLGRGMGAATLLFLEAPSLGALAGDVRYGGRQFDTTGELGTPATTTLTPEADGSYRFTLPNAAIALLTISPTRGGR